MVCVITIQVSSFSLKIRRFGIRTDYLMLPKNRTVQFITVPVQKFTHCVTSLAAVSGCVIAIKAGNAEQKGSRLLEEHKTWDKGAFWFPALPLPSRSPWAKTPYRSAHHRLGGAAFPATLNHIYRILPFLRHYQ